MELSSHFKGEITEQLVAIEFLKQGIMISKPLVQSSRYDFIVDVNHRLYKIQVKTGRSPEEGVLEFNTSTSHTNTRGTKNLTYETDDVNYFATMHDGQCYLIPIELCGKSTQRIRFVPTKNGQTKGILFAKDYKLEDVIQTM